MQNFHTGQQVLSGVNGRLQDLPGGQVQQLVHQVPLVVRGQEMLLTDPDSIRIEAAGKKINNFWLHS